MNVQTFTVFIRNKDLPSNLDARVNDFDLCEAINDALGKEVGVSCIQRNGEIWRVELESEEDCQKLVKEGIKINEPFPRGVKIRTPKGMEKILICGLPCSANDKDIKVMLSHCGICDPTGFKTSTEVICDTNKDTRVLNGNRSVFIRTIYINRFLPRNATCAGAKCRLYHSGQKPRTSQVQCYREVCRVCLQPNYSNHNENIIILPPLLLTEANRSCRSAIKTETKKDDKKLMEEILLGRFQNEKFPEYLKIVESLTSCTVIAEANVDRYWGTGLNEEDTIHKNKSEWPGKNVLGSLVKEIALSYVTKLTFYSLNVGGLNTGEKIPTLFEWLKGQEIDIVLLQETHLKDGGKCEDPEWLDMFDFYHRFSDSSRKKGVSILVRKSTSKYKYIRIEEIDSDSEPNSLKQGRKKHVTVTYKDKSFHLINVYVPHSGNQYKKNKFLLDLSEDIENKCKENLDNIILAGDLNCHRDNQKDPGDKSLEQLLENFSLMDAWMTRSGKTSEEGNTYLSEKNGNPVTRIDYVFYSEKLYFPLFDISIEEPPNRENDTRYSDHLGLYFELNTCKV